MIKLSRFLLSYWKNVGLQKTLIALNSSGPGIRDLVVTIKDQANEKKAVTTSFETLRNYFSFEVQTVQ